MSSTPRRQYVQGQGLSLALKSAKKQDLADPRRGAGYHHQDEEQDGDDDDDDGNSESMINPMSSPYRGIAIPNQEEITKTPRTPRTATPRRRIIAAITPSKLTATPLNHNNDGSSNKAPSNEILLLENEDFIQRTSKLTPMTQESQRELIDNFTVISSKVVDLQQINNSLSNFNESFASFLYGFNINAYCCSFDQAPSIKTPEQRMDLIKRKKMESFQISKDIDGLDSNIKKLKFEIQKLKGTKSSNRLLLSSTSSTRLKRPVSRSQSMLPPLTPASTRLSSNVNRKPPGVVVATGSSSSGSVTKHTNFLRGSGKSSQLRKQRESIIPPGSSSIHYNDTSEFMTPSSINRAGSSRRSTTTPRYNSRSNVDQKSTMQASRIPAISSNNRAYNISNKKSSDEWSIKGRKPFR